jgi:tetratricopeptide (TPR) repeat protein
VLKAWAALAWLVTLATAAPGAASDFWDAVRNPGLAAERLHLRRAEEALAQNQADRALAETEAVVNGCPDCAQGHVLRGRALAALGRADDAIAAFERSLALSAGALDDEGAALAAATIAIRVGRADLGTAILTRTLALTSSASTRSAGLVMLADALLALGPGELKRAIAAYGQAMADDGARRHAVLGLALALHRKGEQAQALALARRAEQEGDPAAASAWLSDPERAARIALWLTAIDDHAAAEKAWLRAAEGDGPWSGHARAAHDALSQRAGVP